MTVPERAAVEAAVRDLGELANRWLTWFDGDQDWDPPVSMPERRSEIADHLRQVRTILAELERLGRHDEQPTEATGGEQAQNGRPLIERLPPEDAERVAALIDERDCWRKEVLDLRARVAATTEQVQDGAAPFVTALTDKVLATMQPVVAMSVRHLLASRSVWRAHAYRNSAERDALAARVAELTAEPKTFECEVCTKPITSYPCVLCEHEPDPWKKPAEQQPAEATGGEQAQDGAAGKARALLVSSSKRTRFGRVFVEHLLAEHDDLREQLAAVTARAEKAEAHARSLTAAVQAAADFGDAVKRIRELPAPDLGTVAAANAAFVAAAADRIAALDDGVDDEGDVPCVWCHCDGCDECTGIHGVVCGCRNPVQR